MLSQNDLIEIILSMRDCEGIFSFIDDENNYGAFIIEKPNNNVLNVAFEE